MASLSSTKVVPADLQPTSDTRKLLRQIRSAMLDVIIRGGKSRQEYADAIRRGTTDCGTGSCRRMVESIVSAVTEAQPSKRENEYECIQRVIPKIYKALQEVLCSLGTSPTAAIGPYVRKEAEVGAVSFSKRPRPQKTSLWNRKVKKDSKGIKGKNTLHGDNLDWQENPIVDLQTNHDGSVLTIIDETAQTIAGYQEQGFQLPKTEYTRLQFVKSRAFGGPSFWTDLERLMVLVFEEEWYASDYAQKYSEGTAIAVSNYIWLQHGMMFPESRHSSGSILAEKRRLHLKGWDADSFELATRDGSTT